MSVNSQFKSQLPFRCQFLGRYVTFERPVDGHVPLKVSDEASPIVIRQAFHDWEKRKGYGKNGPEERENFRLVEERLMKAETIRAFVSFYLTQPVGVRMFVFNTGKHFYNYVGRLSAIDEAVLTWDAITNWDRDSSGKLKLSIPCCGYRNRLAKHEAEPMALHPNSVSRCLCSSNVVDLSACCSAHKKRDSKTLFTHYPFFGVEGFPELMP